MIDVIVKDTDCKLIGSELPCAVFSYFPKRVNMFLNTEKSMMMLFYEASIQEKYASLFDNYPFDTDGSVGPWSNTLLDALNDMHGLLFTHNNDSTIYMFEESAKISFDKFIEKNLSMNQKILVRALSEGIQTNFKVLTS